MTKRLHTFWSDDEIWARAEERAAAEDVTMTTVLVRALQRYGKGLGLPPKPVTRKPSKKEESK